MMKMNAIVVLSCLFVVAEAFLGGSRNYVRFRRPDDVWEPPFRTILCGSIPLRVQIYADPDEDNRKLCYGMNVLINSMG
uniref:Secreted protein n=1 Tax=Ascaris lumbricoides TaxID=6252 RepID=A0A9J2Q3P9_ASCLU